jgi:Jacalin-like lectin domain
LSSTFGPAGGVGGSPYDAPYPVAAQANRPWSIVAMKGRSGSRIDQIQVVWGGAGGGGESPEFGGEGGSPFEFTIPSGESLAQIVGSVGEYNGSVRLFSIQFVTDTGTRSDVYGKATSAAFSFECPANFVITGIFGRAKNEVDALGVYIAHT